MRDEMIDRLRGQVPDMRAEADDLHREAAKLEQRAAHIERIIEGIEGLTGPTPSPGPPLFDETSENGADKPRGIGAVRRVMRESPSRVWRAKDVHRVLEQRGWLSPEAKFPLRGTEAAINRLWKAKELDRVGSGRYRIKLDVLPEQALDAEGTL
jgi:hypothetical protein